MKEFYWNCIRCGAAQMESVHALCDACYAIDYKATVAKIKVESVDHPKHYNQIKGVECIDVVEQMSFNLGNAMKYIWRCEEKGNKLQDLKKAVWYINREISNYERMEKETDTGSPEEN